MSLNTFGGLRSFFCNGAVMCMKAGKFYVVRVDDLKPVLREQLTESIDANDLVYLVCPERNHVVISDVCVSQHPQVSEAA